MPVNFDDEAQVKAFRDSVLSQGADPLETDKYIGSKRMSKVDQVPLAQQGNEMSQPLPQKTILAERGTFGTPAGARQKADVFSGGINYGRDIPIESGVPVAVPPGEWKVVEAYGDQTRVGRIGDPTNDGYGNSVVLVNQKTNEMIRPSHLSPGLNVKKNQIVTGGTIIGRTGQTGNTSGPHLDIEYYDSSGRNKDIMNSPYGQYLMGE